MAFDPHNLHPAAGDGAGFGEQSRAAAIRAETRRIDASARRLAQLIRPAPPRAATHRKKRRPGVVWVRPRELILHLSGRLAGYAMAQQDKQATSARAWTSDRLGQIATYARNAVPRPQARPRQQSRGPSLAPLEAFGAEPTSPTPPSRTIQR